MLMTDRKSGDTPGIDEVRARFEDWRGTRKGKARIPDELWSAAIAVARRDGINQTAAALRLDGGKLKRLMLAAKPSLGKTMPPATFVELMTPHIGGLPECTIELEGQNRKLRIHWKGATAADVCGLSRVLWDEAS
jgi:hypothetical protein